MKMIMAALVSVVMLFGPACTLRAQSSQTITWTTGPHPGATQAGAGGSTVTYNGQPCTQGAFFPYQWSGEAAQDIIGAQGSLYGCGDGFALEGISMTYGPVIPLATALGDGSTHAQIFTMSVDAAGAHWSGSFTEYYKKLTKLSCSRRCVYVTVYEPTQGTGTLNYVGQPQ